MVCDVIGKVIQRNSRFGVTDRLEVHLEHLRMTAGNGIEKMKGRSLNVVSAIKSV